MKYHNFLIALMLCMGLSFPQVKAGEFQEDLMPSSWFDVGRMKDYVVSSLTSGYNKVVASGKSAQKFITDKIGLKNFIISLGALLIVARQLGINQDSLIEMIKNVPTSVPALVQGTINVAGRAAATGAVVAGGLATAAVSTPGIIALTGAGAYWARREEAINKLEPIALEAVNASLTDPTKYTNDVKEIIAREASRRLYDQSKDASKITKQDFINKLTRDDAFYARVLVSCVLREPDGDSRAIIRGMAHAFLTARPVLKIQMDKELPALRAIIKEEEEAQKAGLQKQTGGQLSPVNAYNPYAEKPLPPQPVTNQANYTQTLYSQPSQLPQATATQSGQTQQPQSPYRIMQGGQEFQLMGLQLLYNPKDGYWYGKVPSGQEFYLNPTTGYWEQWIARKY
jgi:hypothetical protein